MNIKREELEMELAALHAVRGMVESDEFRKIVLEPVKRALESLKDSYDCDSLKELGEVKGKKEGLRVFLDIVEGLNQQIQNKQFDVDNSPEE